MNKKENKKGVTFDLTNAKTKVLEDTETQLTKEDEANKEKARLEYERIESILKVIEEKSKADIGYLLYPDRYEKESFEEFKMRRTLSKKYVKHKKQGTTFFQSSKIEVKTTGEGEDKKVEIHTTTKTYSNPMRKNIEYRKANKNKI